MRITQNSSISSYLLNINDLRDRFNQAQSRIATGKEVQKPSDNPRIIGEIKRLTTSIEKNDTFIKNLEDGLTDTNVYEDGLQNFANTLISARGIAQEAANPVNGDKLDVLGDRILDLVGDLVEIANFEFDGRFAFAGTLTTRNAITPSAPETNTLPFELVEDPALVSTGNPRGLRVAFKGNNEERLIATSSNSTERVNSLAQDAFGAGSAQVFDELIEIYNILAFKPDGSTRTNTDDLTPTEAEQLRSTVKDLGDSIDRLHSEIGRVGGVINRMTALRDQLAFENSRLRDLRSIREDADLVQAAVALQKEEFGLNAALGIGPTLFQQSLLDFLS